MGGVGGTCAPLRTSPPPSVRSDLQGLTRKIFTVQAGLCQASHFLPPHDWDVVTSHGLPAQSPCTVCAGGQTSTGSDSVAGSDHGQEKMRVRLWGAGYPAQQAEWAF